MGYLTLEANKYKYKERDRRLKDVVYKWNK